MRPGGGSAALRGADGVTWRSRRRRRPRSPPTFIHCWRRRAAPPPPLAGAGPGRAAVQPVSAARGAAGGAGEGRPLRPYIGRRVGRSWLRGSGVRAPRRARRAAGGAVRPRGERSARCRRRFGWWPRSGSTFRGRRQAPCRGEESRPACGGAILLFKRRDSGCEGRSRRVASFFPLPHPPPTTPRPLCRFPLRRRSAASREPRAGLSC